MLYPSDLEKYLANCNLSIQGLQADRSVICILDADLRIVFCNWSWDRFAFQNGGFALSHLFVVGTSVLDVTPESLQPFYTSAYTNARKTGQHWEHDFECSSPENFRLFHMRVLPIGGPYLCVENSLRVERPHEAATEPSLPLSRYVDENGLTVMCCHCRRTRQARNIGNAKWHWIPDFLKSPPKNVSHGLCELCLHFFYPDARPLA
jgi:hypothetical protein